MTQDMKSHSWAMPEPDKNHTSSPAFTAVLFVISKEGHRCAPADEGCIKGHPGVPRNTAQPWEGTKPGHTPQRSRAHDAPREPQRVRKDPEFQVLGGGQGGEWGAAANGHGACFGGTKMFRSWLWLQRRHPETRKGTVCRTLKAGIVRTNGMHPGTLLETRKHAPGSRKF